MTWHHRRSAFAAGLIIVLAILAGIPARAQPAFTPGAGTEGRHWLPDRPTAATPLLRYSVDTTDDVGVIARDGTRLDGRLLTPELAAGAAPMPCVLMTDGYGRNSATGAALEVPLFDIAARGYAVLHLSLRGSGKTGGANDVYSHYGTDGYDAIEWMARQSWCNGRVAMVGPSLLGISQWLTAKEAPPSLKAIVPEVACGDCYGVLWYPGGMLPGPGREARKLSPGAEAEYPAATAHRDFDSWWQARTTLADDVAAISARGVAAFIAGGLDDYISPANIRAYEQFNAPGNHKRLFLGPYAHGWHTAWFQELQVQWLDHFLKGAANGADTDPAVVLYIKGANRWRTESDWPIADARPVKLYLDAAHSGSIASLNDGSLAPQAPGAAAPASLPYTPSAGPFLPVLLSATEGRSGDDQRPEEEHVATWTTAPLLVPTEVTGYPKLAIWAASTATDADLVFSLDDVAPDGTSRQMIQAYLNAPRAKLRAAPVPLTPGVAAQYTLDMFPLAYVVPAGHRMRLAVAGGAKVAPNLPQPQGPGKNPTASTWTILQDSQHLSSIELPIVGSSWQQLSRTTVTQR